MFRQFEYEYSVRCPCRVLSMSALADKSSEQNPIAHHADYDVVQFVGEALRAGQRVILVTGRGKRSVRAPEAALASASAHALHIEPPLPEPPELQEMIGAAVGIAGGREIAPLAMAARLLFAEPRRSVILAIDDAHTLSHRSLSYLAQMTELLGPDAPVLQIVLAAGPDLLDVLAQPEFDDFRDRIVRPGSEALEIPSRRGDDGAFPDLQNAQDRKAARPTTAEGDVPMAASPWMRRIARPAAFAAAGLVAVGCLGAIGFVAFLLSVSRAPPLAFLQPRPLLTATLVDQGARALGDPPGRTGVSERQRVPPEGSVLSAEEEGDARTGDRREVTFNASGPVSPGADPDRGADGVPPAMQASATPTTPEGPVAPSAEQAGVASSGDQTASPTASGPVSPDAVYDQAAYGPSPAMQATAIPTTAEVPAERLGATGYGGRSALIGPTRGANHAARSAQVPSRNHGRDFRRRHGADPLKTMALDAAAAIRGFFQHILPSGPHHLRRNGSSAGANRARDIGAAG